MQFKVKNLNSKYIPVHNVWYAKNDNIHWWLDNSKFYYPNVLINLDTIKWEDFESVYNKDMFLLTDSGGFQVISGICKLNWHTSLLKQIELKASKIFAFDTPPVIKLTNSTQFSYLPNEETKNIIKNNLDVAIKQSDYLKQHYSNEQKKFCYIMHAKNKNQLDYNMELFETTLGNDYDKYFPGGIVYAVKSQNPLYTSYAMAHAKKNFIEKGKYVHFLGMGSFNRMVLLIKNGISTFDSSNALLGCSRMSVNNPIDLKSSMDMKTTDWIFESSFCQCPICNDVNYTELINSNNTAQVGRHLILHNLWKMLDMNIMLDAIKKSKYTEVVNNLFNLSDDIKESLNISDSVDNIGLDKTYEKYKQDLDNIRSVGNKQTTLF